MKTVIIISPHPDDLEIGMGGAAAKLLSAGYQLVSVVVTDGRRSTNIDNLSQDSLAAVREEEVRKSCKILGISSLHTLGLRDLNTKENTDSFRQSLGEILWDTPPEEIYIPHPEIDKHPTHKKVSSVVLDLLGELKSDNLVTLACWCYEVWTPFERYDRIEDITDYIKLKTQAIKAHKSQIAYKDYVEGMLGLNRYRAVFDETSGFSDMEYAEVFIKYDLSFTS